MAMRRLGFDPMDAPLSEASIGSNPSPSMVELPMSEPEPVIYELCDQPSYGRAEVTINNPCLPIVEMAMYEPERLDLTPISEPAPYKSFMMQARHLASDTPYLWSQSRWKVIQFSPWWWTC